MMQHSKAYLDFIDQSKATGYQRMQGYDSKLFEKILPEERRHIEELIVSSIENGDSSVSKFSPFLYNFDGVGLLESALSNCVIPSENSLEYATALYKSTNESRYLEVHKQNLVSNDANHRLLVIGYLMECNPNDQLYEIFEERCLNDDDELVRDACATGLLYCKGLIRNPLDYNELSEELKEIEGALSDDDYNVRYAYIQKLKQIKAY